MNHFKTDKMPLLSVLIELFVDELYTIDTRKSLIISLINTSDFILIYISQDKCMPLSTLNQSPVILSCIRNFKDKHHRVHSSMLRIKCI